MELDGSLKRKKKKKRHLSKIEVVAEKTDLEERSSKKKTKAEPPPPVVVEGPLVPQFAEVDAADHCETPLEAYQDVVVFLDVCASQLRKTRAELSIYDPYYCAGGVVERLASLGFSSVRNEPVDCYSSWDSVEYDVLVTNPPYSGDHIEKMCAFLARRKKPFAVLVPNFVVKKPFHKTLVEPLRPFFLVPRQRYIYLPPAGAREKKASDTHKKTSPFVTIWHCWMSNVQQVCDQVFRKVRDDQLQMDVCRSKNTLRDLRRK
jgi:hypothetical protein